MSDIEIRPRFNWFGMFWDGFRNMKIGKTLWIIVVIKLIIMFAILKPIFFPNFLKTRFQDDRSKSDYVREQLINKSNE